MSANDLSDPTYGNLPAFGMILVELCVGISASCMPPIAPLLRNRAFKWSSLSICFTVPFQRLYNWSRRSDYTQTTSYSSRSVPLGNPAPKYDSTDARSQPRLVITQTRWFPVGPHDEESIPLEEYAQTRPTSIPRSKDAEGEWI